MSTADKGSADVQRDDVTETHADVWQVFEDGVLKSTVTAQTSASPRDDVTLIQGSITPVDSTGRPTSSASASTSDVAEEVAAARQTVSAFQSEVRRLMEENVSEVDAPSQASEPISDRDPLQAVLNEICSDAIQAHESQ